MSSVDLSPPAPGSWSPLALRQAWLNIDQNSAAVAFVRSTIGKFALHFAFIAALALSQQLSTAALGLISVTLFAVAAMPAQRMAIICFSSLFFLAMRPFRIDGWTALLNSKAAALPTGIPALGLQLSAVVVFLAIAAGYLRWQYSHKDHIAAKRPVVALMTSWGILTCLAWSLPSQSIMSAVLWTISGVWISSFWYLAYAAADQKTKDQTPTLARASLMRPFWGGSATPIGKSFGYLNKFDAKDDDELAATRLKALKLAVWGCILVAIMQGMRWLVYGQFGIPELEPAILAFAQGEAFSTGANWVSVIINYFMDLLVIAVWGHFIVATVRMLGYRIPRNTRNPLASRTLAEFWNRYFFYFKELLVDFFFYPTFVRYFKKNTKVRVAFATFCAATLGNFLYHFARETYVFASLPVSEALQIFHSAIFYSFALGAGLVISQWRGVKLKPEDGFIRYDVLPRINVFAFFCFLKIFDDISGQGSLSDRAQFTLSLFNL